MSPLSRESLELLSRARRGEAAPPGARERGKRRLLFSLGAGAAATSVGATGAAAAAPAALTLKSTLVYLAIGVASGSFVSGASVVVQGWPNAEVPRSAPKPATGSPVPRLSERPTSSGTKTAHVPTARVDARETESVSPPQDPPSGVPRTGESSRSLSAPAGGPNGIAPVSAASAQLSKAPEFAAPSAAAPRIEPDEMAGLLAAQRALREGNPALALSRLDEHAARFRHSQFDEERSAARLLALCALGRLEEGRALLETFRRRFPASPATPRVGAACR